MTIIKSVCKECTKEFEQPQLQTLKQFCNHSCAAKFNNRLKTKSQIKTVNCLYCNKQFTIKVSAAGNGYSTSGKFCSRKCCGLYTAQHITINKVKKGEIASSTTLRKALIHLYGNKCGECGSLPLWNGKPLVLQLHHKDGDACNNVITNLQLLCPNCHSQTDNHSYKKCHKSTRYKKHGTG